MGIILKHDKDRYETTSITESKSFFLSFRGFRNLPRTTCSSLHLQMDGWKMIHILLGHARPCPAYFQVLLLSVFFRVYEALISYDSLRGVAAIV